MSYLSACNTFGRKSIHSRFIADFPITRATTTLAGSACTWFDEQIKNISYIIAKLKEISKIPDFVRGVKAQSFVSTAKDHIFVVPNLVLFGLNPILNHNVE